MRIARLIHTLGSLTQIALTVLTGVYVFLTWRLVNQTADQMIFSREQHRVALAPYLLVAVTDVDDTQAKAEVERNTKLTPKQKKDALKQIADTAIQYACTVTNPTSKVANNLVAILFDSGTQSFLFCDNGKEVLVEGAKEGFWFGWTYLNEREVRDHARQAFSEPAPFLDQVFATGATSYVVILFRDMEGRLYAFKRPFSISKEGEITHQPGTYAFDRKQP